MKLLTVSVLVCSMMALAGAAGEYLTEFMCFYMDLNKSLTDVFNCPALQEAEKENEAAITQEGEYIYLFR